jgi:hypothetical protein
MGSSQPDVGGLGHPWATYMNPQLFLLLASLRGTAAGFPQAVAFYVPLAV